MCERTNRDRRDWLERFMPQDTKTDMLEYLDSLEREDLEEASSEYEAALAEAEYQQQRGADRFKDFQDQRDRQGGE